ncbi:MAG: conjugal transfer protein TraG N-terminal domain-containing protein [Gammaproteobacteria bacterium]|nr:conjugal transfer protein TraG N-terminal domain-containing protein [Gammaproteobacteria bacterium]
MTRLLTLLALLTAPGVSFALETDFYTYNGFDETVAAFTRLGLMLSDNHFLVFATIFAIAGAVLGALSTAYRGISGDQVNPVGFLIPIALGLAVFKAFVMSTGTVHIYDPVRNAYQPVGGVPDIIVAVAGGLNKLERGIIEIADTASANPYSDSAGAISFALIKAAVSASVNDWYLKQSLVNYYTACGMPALANMDTGARQRLMHGSTDLINEFGEWTNAALSTVYHAAGDDTGEARTCTDAWSGTGGLNSRLTNASTFAGVTESICMQAGFNITDGAQSAKCRSLLQDSTALYNVSAGSEVPFLRSILLAEAVSNAMNSSDMDRSTRTLVSRQVMAEGLGNAEAMNQWIPKVRAFMLAVVLGVVPLTLLFVVTPLIKPALMLNFGLFAWLSLWSIGDGIAVQMAYDAASDAFDQIRRQQLGVEAIMMSPEGAVQALGVFGKSRSTALAMASVLAFGLFKFGGYALTGLGQQWQNNIEGAGDQAGRQTLYPEQNASAQQSLMAVGGTMGQVNSGGGFRQGSLASGMGAIRQTGGAGAYIDDSITTGRAPGGTLGDVGRLDAREQMGDVSGTVLGAARVGMPMGDFRERNAETRAGMGGIDLNTQRRELEGAFGNDFLRGPEARATQSVAGDVALSKEKPKDLYDAAATETRQRVEAGVTLGNIAPNAATDSGRAQGTFTYAQSQGTLRTLEDRGLPALVTGEEVARQQNVAQGLAIQGISPALGRTTDVLATASAAENYARAQIGNDLANQLGMNGADVRDRIDLSMMQNGQIGMAVTDGNRAQLVDYFRRSGAMGERELADFENSGGGFVRFAFDGESGRADAAQADFVSSTVAGSTTGFTDGRSVRVGDNTHFGNVYRDGNERREGDVTVIGDELRKGDSTDIGNRKILSESLSISDPNSLRGPRAAETLTNLVDDLTGKLEAREVYAVADAYSRRLQLEGYGANASADASEVAAADAGLSGAAGVRRGTGGSANVSASMRTQSSEGNSARQDLVVTGFVDQLAPNLERAQEITYQQYGRPESWNPDTAIEAERMIAEQWAGRNDVSFAEAKHAIQKQTYMPAAKADEQTFIQKAREATAGTWADKAYSYVDRMFE